MVIISIGVVIKKVGLVYCEIDRILKGLRRIILFIAGDVVDLIVVIIKKAKDGIATTAIDLEISFVQIFISNYTKKVKTISICFIKIAYSQ